MSDCDLEAFRALLLQQKDELEALAQASGEAAGAVELDQTRVGRLSRMDAMQAQSMAREAVRRRKEQLARIEGALRRIDSGDFGLCFVCDEEIDEKRLRFDPTTTRCVTCKDKQ